MSPWQATAGSSKELWRWTTGSALEPGAFPDYSGALAASTDGQGTVAPGNRSDLVLLDDDPLQTVTDFAAVAARLRGMQVAVTLVAGHDR